jgi:transposase
MSKKGVCVHGENNSHQITREQLVTAMLEEQTWQQVNTGFPVPLKRAMAYRLLRAVRAKGNIALLDGRHGHPSKLRGEVRAFLEAYCREAPSTPSCVLQTLLQEHFGLSVSRSQINRIRTALGVSNRSQTAGQGKKQK